MGCVWSLFDFNFFLVDGRGKLGVSPQGPQPREETSTWGDVDAMFFLCFQREVSIDAREMEGDARNY